MKEQMDGKDVFLKTELEKALYFGTFLVREM